MKIFTENVHWLLRITLCITFLMHGYPKIVDPSGLISMGLPRIIGYLIGPFEVGGGILLILGPFLNSYITRIGAGLIAIIMLGAIFFVHISDGWQALEWQVLILSTSILFIVKGNDV